MVFAIIRPCWYHICVMNTSNMTLDLKFDPNMAKGNLKPFIKWAGGKEKELKCFQKYFPKSVNNYFEPFLGGGAVYFCMANASLRGDVYVNDISTELIGIYECVKQQDSAFFDTLNAISDNFDFMGELAAKYEIISNYVCERIHDPDDAGFATEILYNAVHLDHIKLHGFLYKYTELFEFKLKASLVAKYRQLRKIKAVENARIDAHETIETAFKMALYNTIRDLYNSSELVDGFKLATLFFVREFCFSSMFRYNADGEFNIPYGGRSYNTKNFRTAVNYLKSPELIEYLNRSYIENSDYHDFFEKWKETMSKDDFVFVDPPYDTAFSEYDRNEFNREDQKRLAETLSSFGEQGVKVMIVIKKTDFIFDLYKSYGFNIDVFRKKYSVNCHNRNDRDVEHLIITNYEVDNA